MGVMTPTVNGLANASQEERMNLKKAREVLGDDWSVNLSVTHTKEKGDIYHARQVNQLKQ